MRRFIIKTRLAELSGYGGLCLRLESPTAQQEDLSNPLWSGWGHRRPHVQNQYTESATPAESGIGTLILSDTVEMFNWFPSISQSGVLQQLNSVFYT